MSRMPVRSSLNAEWVRVVCWTDTSYPCRLARFLRALFSKHVLRAVLCYICSLSFDLGLLREFWLRAKTGTCTEALHLITSLRVCELLLAAAVVMFW
jgi:hypothetical protein